MNYDLSRVDYTICGITYPDTLKILPASDPRVQQKFVIGDKTGVLQCLAIKDEEPVVQFKTLPGKPVTSVHLASAYPNQVDKIFAAAGNEVKGYTRKGKVFLAIETSLSETITSMCIAGGDLVLGSGGIVTHYRDLQELQSYTCEDRVLDIAAFTAPNSTRLRLLALIANKGAVILEAGQMAARVTISSGPSRLAVPPWMHSADACAYFGAADGSIGLVTYDGTNLTGTCLVQGKGLGSVICIGWFFNHCGTHLIIGRHDGSIQLYLLDTANLMDPPRLKYTYFCGEPVTSVCGGSVGTEESEVLAATYSGRIFALRSHRLISATTARANIPQDALVARRTKLESEILRLQKQAANEREKYQRNTRRSHAGLSTPPLLDIQCELSGAITGGWQEARITSAVPLDMLFLYCLTKLELQTDNAAVLSVCSSQTCVSFIAVRPPLHLDLHDDMGNASDLLATVRCQAGTRRLWVHIRNQSSSSITTKCTKLLLYALPAGAPRVARLITLRLPVLPFYSKHEDPDLEEDRSRPWCELRASGSFSVAEISSWLVEALPGDLPRPSSSVAFARSHKYNGTTLVCRYQRGIATLKCDDVSTMAILRDIVSNSSIEKSIRVELATDIPEDYCIRAFENIKDYYIQEYKKHQDTTLFKALSALDLDGEAAEEEPVLCEDYLRVCKTSANETETHFDEIVETIRNWYTDWHKFKRRGTEEALSEQIRLDTSLRECNIEVVKQILSDESDIPD